MATALRLLASHLAGLPGLRLEYSLGLGRGRIADSGRVTVWLCADRGADVAPLGPLLQHLGADRVVRRAQLETAARAKRQGLGLSAGPEGLEWRLYLHEREPQTPAKCYTAWRWGRGGRARRSSYRFAFLPEDTAGRRPEELVPHGFRSSFQRLLAQPWARLVGGFWLRWDDGPGDPELKQVDLAFPWQPTLQELLPLLAEALPRLGVRREELQSLSRHRFRHVALRLGKTPRLTLYASGPAPTSWPSDEEALRAGVQQAAGREAARVERLLAALPTPPAAQSRSRGPDLDTFYGYEVSVWERILGPGLHYHGGFFEDPTLRSVDDPTLAVAMRRAVDALLPFLPREARIYDLGCGWGGPLEHLTRVHRRRVLGCTISRAQYRFCGARGLSVRWADAEQTLPPGHFDAILMLEAFSHIRDKLRFLRLLRPFTPRLVLVVNCQDARAASSRFGGSMELVSSGRLRELLCEAGWRIRHWRDRRPAALPSLFAWHQRLSSIPPTGDHHVETLRAWTRRVVQVAEAWGASNPLIEVVAER